MEKWNLFMYVKLGWIIASLILLIFSEVNYYNTGAKDADVIMIIGMIILSFPSSFVAIGLFFMISYAGFDPYAEQNFGYPAGMFALWSVLTLFGYFQWFIVSPFLLRKFRSIQKKWTSIPDHKRSVQ